MSRINGRDNSATTVSRRTLHRAVTKSRRKHLCQVVKRPKTCHPQTLKAVDNADNLFQHRGAVKCLKPLMLLCRPVTLVCRLPILEQEVKFASGRGMPDRVIVVFTGPIRLMVKKLLRGGSAVLEVGISLGTAEIKSSDQQVQCGHIHAGIVAKTDLIGFGVLTQGQ